MKLFEDLTLSKSKTESGWHKSVKDSFLFVPRASMRSAPDELIIELYRELFFSKRANSSARSLRPDVKNETDNDEYSWYEQVALYAARGRRKQLKNASSNDYYTPAYPSLARNSWPRENSERVVRDLFFRAIAQYLHGSGKNKDAIKDFTSILISALAGSNIKDSSARRDIIGLKVNNLQGCCDINDTSSKLEDLLGVTTVDKSAGYHKAIFSTVGRGNDPLAETIYNDVLQLCELEKKIDRLQWLALFKTYMRLSTSIWLLSHMKITIELRNKLLESMTQKNIFINEGWIDSVIETRFEKLFQPSITPTNQIGSYIGEYIKARSELNLLVGLVEKYSQENLSGKIISPRSGSSDEIGIDKLINLGNEVADQMQTDLNGHSLRTLLTRQCEKYSSWRALAVDRIQPGQGYLEYLIVLRKMDSGDEDGGYLLTASRGRNKGFKIFPGNLMITLIAFFAARNTSNRKFVLSDIESHFKKYGVDFSERGGSRPKLIGCLQDMGLLKGSPDAGDSVAVTNPYEHSNC